jgi:PEGA domain
MNRSINSICGFLSFLVLFASCSSTTMIVSNPSKAKVYIDGALAGETPYQHTDSKIVGSTMTLKIEKDGFKPLIATITKDEDVDVGAVIGGLFTLVPFLWTMKYNPVHNYVLEPINLNNNTLQGSQQAQPKIKSKVEKLRELKQLLDEKIINQQEFDKEKVKILEENE